MNPPTISGEHRPLIVTMYLGHVCATWDCNAGNGRLLPASCPRHPQEKSSPNHCNNTAHTSTPCVYTPLYDRFWWCGRPVWVRRLVSPESERHPPPPLSVLGNCAGTRYAGTDLRAFTATGFIRDVPCCPDGTGAMVHCPRPHTLCQVDPCSPEGHGSTPNEAPRCSQGIWGWQLHCTEDEERVIFYPNRPGAWTEQRIDQRRWWINRPHWQPKCPAALNDCRAEVARAIEEFRDGHQHWRRREDTRHHDQTPSVQTSFTKDVRALVSVIEELGNPFEEESMDMIVLDTKEIAGPAAVETVRNVKKIGQEQFQAFTRECLVERTQSINDAIRRNKLKVFNTSTPGSVSKDKQHLASLRNDVALFSRHYIGCQTRDGNLEEFFRHENHTCPPALSDGESLHPSTKSDLLKCFEEFSSAQSEVPDTPA